MATIQDSIHKVAEQAALSQEIMARNVTTGILVNIINAYLKVHSLSEVEIKALQDAINVENQYTQYLVDSLVPAEPTPAKNAESTENAESAENTESEKSSSEEIPEEPKAE